MKAFFFFLTKILVYYYANGRNPKQRDDAGKGVCDPEKRYHPENVLRCQLVAKTFHLFVTGLFLCPILVIRIWRGSPLSQISDSKEPCLPTLAPIALSGSGISVKQRLSGGFSGQPWVGRGWFSLSQPKVCLLKEPFVPMLEETNF